jgi:hypothetical protein
MELAFNQQQPLLNSLILCIGPFAFPVLAVTKRSLHAIASSPNFFG